MDKALDYGSRDCRFESCQSHIWTFFMVGNAFFLQKVINRNVEGWSTTEHIYPSSVGKIIDKLNWFFQSQFWVKLITFEQSWSLLSKTDFPTKSLLSKTDFPTKSLLGQTDSNLQISLGHNLQVLSPPDIRRTKPPVLSYVY